MKILASLFIFVLNILPMMALPSSVGNSSPETKQEAKARKKEVKKQLEQVKASLKSGSNLQGVESSLNKLLQDSLNQKDERLYLALYDVLKKQYQQGNEKLFLKQKYDTASLFVTARKMFLLLDRFDSIDAFISPSAMAALGNAYAHTKQIDKAVSCLKKAADMANSEAKDGVNISVAPTCLMQAARLLESQNKNDEALSIYKEIKTKYVKSYYNSEIDKYIERLTK